MELLAKTGPRTEPWAAAAGSMLPSLPAVVTFSGAPEAMLPSPRSASILTKVQVSFCLPVMLSIMVSSRIRSFTTLLLRS